MLKTIILTLGFLALIEGLVIILFPKTVGKGIRKISSKKKITKAGILEIITSLVFIAIGFIIN
ncbi:MAG TPA: hypothetical protein VJ912_03210 [Candidatus Nanoarchaeia archaeon]|nr:hypothetical protein [Candidatus Nanoarchaeia archaeon]